MDKEIFLDIAFFFIGEGKNHVTQVLEACGFRAISGIENLMDKALIKTNHDCKIVMHDLVQEMGEQIVREECSKYPELRSRLNDADEICDVLQRNMGTDKIEGIILDWNRINHLRLSPDTFTKMTNLRILKICHPWYSFEEKKNSKLFYYLGSFPNKLRYFHWDLYPLEFLPLEGYCFKNLVVLRMQHSNIKKLWDGVQDLVNLKMLDLRRSRQLMELPDFSRAHNLEEVYLSGCESLCSVHPSIFCLQSLVTLDVSHCEKSESLYHGSFPNKLRHFSWEQYPLESLPLGLCIKNLVELCIMDSNIKKLWDGVQDLMNLKTLSLSGCKQLVELPNFSMARNLEEVDLGGCESLHSVHPSILSLQSLVGLNVSDCKELESLESETHLESLSYLGVEDCQSLKKFSVSSKKLDGLCFDGTEVEILHLLPMGGFTELRLLEIYGERLRSLPISELCSLTNLEGFQIWDFQQMQLLGGNP
ncbi:disease resistance protein RPV1-like [Prosopis cineraria]|uniref:disease resistance protein RPV1-like n=1 Tax=Prosopis cineraria TaxID=364024 RepID=UPI0024107D93|nr:disease resistance protein RPV1-like [Prosopis cineraria]